MMILLEGVPTQIKLQEVTQELMKVEGIKGVHDLHIWTIASGFYALTGHITIEDQMLSRAEQILNRVSQLLKERFSLVKSSICVIRARLETHVLDYGSVVGSSSLGFHLGSFDLCKPEFPIDEKFGWVLGEDK